MVTEARLEVPFALQCALDALDPAAPLPARLEALEAVALWVGRVSRLRRTAPHQLARLTVVIRALETDPAHRARLSATLASVLRDANAVHLFSEAGLPNDRGLASETVELSREVAGP